MAATQLGTKHLCFSCKAKFYDLGRPELVCPKCGANQDEAPEKVDMSAIAAKVSDAGLAHLAASRKLRTESCSTTVGPWLHNPTPTRTSVAW